MLGKLITFQNRRRLRYHWAMAKLIYSAITSLDGYTVDADGHFDWSAPDDQVHAFVNDLERPVGTYLYGRRMYEVMRAWQDMLEEPNQSQVADDFARIWQAADKVVYSSTLAAPATPKTRIEPAFQADAVAGMKRHADRDISIGGATLAALAIRAGLVDEWQQLLTPIIVGGGTHFLPPDVRVELDLQDERRFDNGVVYLNYRTRR
jgi:dihydrofolate reductase